MLFYVAFSLVLSGCGKKKESAQQVKDKENTKVALADGASVPLYKGDTQEALLDDEAVADFAFVDEDENAALKKDGKSAMLASNKKMSTLNDASMPMMGDEEALAANEDESGFQRVQFDFDKSSLKKDQLPTVKKDIEVAKSMIQSGKDVVISGHTCQIGSASYNLALSQRRAEAVKAEMLKAGLSGKSIKTVGYGYEFPLVWSDKTNRTEKIQELSPNRRAELASN